MALLATGLPTKLRGLDMDRKRRGDTKSNVVALSYKKLLNLDNTTNIIINLMNKLRTQIIQLMYDCL